MAQLRIQANFLLWRAWYDLWGRYEHYQTRKDGKRCGNSFTVDFRGKFCSGEYFYKINNQTQWPNLTVAGGLFLLSVSYTQMKRKSSFWGLSFLLILLFFSPDACKNTPACVFLLTSGKTCETKYRQSRQSGTAAETRSRCQWLVIQAKNQRWFLSPSSRHAWEDEGLVDHLGHCHLENTIKPTFRMECYGCEYY